MLSIGEEGDITEWTGLKINEAERITQDTHQWHNVLLTASTSQMDNGSRWWQSTMQHRLHKL